jgi:hypothetical protein
LFEVSRSNYPLLTVVDPYENGDLAIERLRAYSEEFPHTTVVVYSEFNAARPQDVAQLARLEQIHLIVAGAEDRPGELAARLASVVGHTVTRRITIVSSPLTSSPSSGPFPTLRRSMAVYRPPVGERN